MFLAASPEFIMVASKNRSVCKVCVVIKQTQMIGYEPIIPTTRPLQRAHSDL